MYGIFCHYSKFRDAGQQIFLKTSVLFPWDEENLSLALHRLLQKPKRYRWKNETALFFSQKELTHFDNLCIINRSKVNRFGI